MKKFTIKTISLLLTILTIFQIIPSEVFAAPSGPVSIEVWYVDSLEETKGSSINTTWTSKFTHTFPVHRAGSNIDKVTLSGTNLGSSSLVVDKSKGTVFINMKSLTSTLFNAPTPTNLRLIVYYKKDVASYEVSLKIPDKKGETGATTSSKAKPIIKTNLNTKVTPKPPAPRLTKDEHKDIATRYVAKATEDQKSLAITLYEYYRQAGALPDIGDKYAERVSALGKIDNDTRIFTEAEINEFYRNKSQADKDRIKEKTLTAIAKSFETEYGEENLSTVAYESASGTRKSFFDEKNFQQLPFIYSFNSLRTAPLFLTLKDDAEAGVEVLDKRNMGNTVEDAAGFNPFYARDSDAGGDFSTRKFGKNPMNNFVFTSILKRNGLWTSTSTSGLWKTLGQIDQLTSDQQEMVINSAIKGIDLLQIEAASRRTWTGGKTFNYLRTDKYDPNNLAEATKLTPEKIQGWKDSLVILQLPSKYSWGSGVMHNLASPGFYVEVPLAPTIGQLDMGVKEVGTTWESDIGAYVSIFEYSTDLMPTVPEELGSVKPQININTVDGEIVAVYVNDELNFTDPNTVDYMVLGQLTVDSKLNSFGVVWRPRADLPPTQNALLYTSLNVFDETFLNTLRSTLIGESKKIVDKHMEEGPVTVVTNNTPNVNVNLYRAVFEEVSYTNNVAKVLKPLPPIDLYLDKVSQDYDKTNEELTITGNVGFTSNGRLLDLSKGELPVELELNWTTEDGQSGSDRIDYNTFDPGTEVPFTFTTSVTMPASGQLVGEFNVRVNPDPINPFEPDIKNNEVTMNFGDSKFIDFEIDPLTTNSKIYRQTPPVNTDVKFVVTLLNTEETINTNVVLYRGATQLQSKSIDFIGGDSQIITFSLPDGQLVNGNNDLYAVVNATRTLSAATPYTTERDITNNRADTRLDVRNTPITDPLSCDFDRVDPNEVDFANPARTGPCESWRKDGSCRRRAVERNDDEYELVRQSNMEYLTPYQDAQNGIFSDDWHRFAEGQKFGKDNSIGSGRSIKNSGALATNELMTAVGYNPLRRVIQAGAGIQIRAKIRVAGYVEEQNGYFAHNKIQNYINDIRNTSMYVSGQNVQGAARNIRNNNGDYTQRMEYDATRSGEYFLNITNGAMTTLGRNRFGIDGRAYVYGTTFTAEIPVIITTATGTIDVLGGKKAPVPSERKWFVYMNELNNTGFGFKLVTTMKPSILEASGGNIDCVLDNVADFRFAVYGTIFDNINIANPPGGGGGNPIWDN